jgi:predicted DNA-binding transcriptional regulator AlpA
MPTSRDEQRLPGEGFVRLSQFVGRGRALPISRSGWWAGIKSGKYPPPVKLSPRISVWPVEEIRRLIKEAGR